MSIEDFQVLDTGPLIETDLCLVGSGPAAWAIAKELQDSGLHILVLESGGTEYEAESDRLSEIADVGEPTFNGRDRILGGSSHTWGGRCIALDDIDYEARPWVPLSGWPFGNGTIFPYLNRAAEFLDVGPYGADGRGPEPDGLAQRPEVDPARLRHLCWQFGRETTNGRGAVHFGPSFRASRNENLRVLVHATVTHLNTDPSGRAIESVEILAPQGRRATVRARAVVLCAGGIENPRIMLYSNRVMPNGVGNAHDTVGRYLMDHPRDPNMIVRFDTRDADRIQTLFGPYKLDNPRGRHVFVHGLALSPELQRRDGLLNGAAWPFEVVAEDDPISAAKRVISGPRAEVVRNVKVAASQPRLVLRAIHARLVQNQSVRRKIERIGFIGTCEQVPDPESRVSLAGRLDRLGLPVARVNWRTGPRERETQAVLAQTIAREFKRLGLPPAHPADWTGNGRTGEVAFIDSCHPTGTTRMALNPREGVVDSDCQVHGVAGLYVAGSSVFPTTGHANPTLMIVALAVRLADCLRERLSTQAKAPAVRETVIA